MPASASPALRMVETTASTFKSTRKCAVSIVRTAFESISEGYPVQLDQFAYPRVLPNATPNSLSGLILGAYQLQEKSVNHSRLYIADIVIQLKLPYGVLKAWIYSIFADNEALAERTYDQLRKWMTVARKWPRQERHLHSWTHMRDNPPGSTSTKTKTPTRRPYVGRCLTDPAVISEIIQTDDGSLETITLPNGEQIQILYPCRIIPA